MGARGPQPKPSALKKAQGNPGRRPLNDGEPIPPTGVPQPPEYLSPVAAQVWAARAPTLIEMRVLTVADVDFFAIYCTLIARYMELQKAFWMKGANGTVFTQKDAKGRAKNVREFPQVGELLQVLQLIVRYGDRFGINPSARSRLNIGILATTPPPASPASGPIDGGPFPISDFFDGGGPDPPRNITPPAS